MLAAGVLYFISAVLNEPFRALVVRVNDPAVHKALTDWSLFIASSAFVGFIWAALWLWFKGCEKKFLEVWFEKPPVQPVLDSSEVTTETPAVKRTIVSIDDLDKYILEQVKIEVEHTRSWPTKILAFYVAVTAGVVTGLLSIGTRQTCPISPSSYVKMLIIVAIIGLSGWVIALLRKNHLSYLRHRNIQVLFQKSNQEELQKRATIPAEWFTENEVRFETRWLGWGFYCYLVILITVLSIAGIWIS
jgi:hypothetical protein